MKYFGTDGVRGVANEELTPELAMKLGGALAYSLRKGLGRRPLIAIGRDTRISGSMLESALAAGICSCGGDAWLLGVMPTPAVAYLTRVEDMDAGVVISASHNPFEHNGIKIFGSDGYKPDDSCEEEIERLIDDLPEEARVTGADMGVVVDKSEEGNERYGRYIMSCAEGDLSGIKVLIDCANGASSHTAEMIFRGLDADCDFISYQPDGININENCGSTHMEELCRRVAEGDYMLGAAFDGDADRCLMCDEKGELIDGDDILALMAGYMKEQGRLKGGVAATIMSNMGLGAYLREHDIPLAATKVGDRHVLEEMRRSGKNIGGEQSGHVILSDYATTGDGQLTAVRFMRMLEEKGVPASQLKKEIFHYPQLMVNVKVPNSIKKQIAEMPRIKELEEEVKAAFNGDGRINIRPSGTEALVRIMVEGKDESLVKAMAEKAEKVVMEVIK